MDRQKLVDRLGMLLRETHKAHREYELAELQGQYDNDWPEWYARYLIERDLAGVLGRQVSVEQLAAQLQAADRRFRADKPDAQWPDYYARLFANNALP